MLVVSRAIGEQIRIGNDIVVKIVDVSGGTVKIGIEAPRVVPVHRQEVYDSISDVNASSRNVKSVDSIL